MSASLLQEGVNVLSLVLGRSKCPGSKCSTLPTVNGADVYLGGGSEVSHLRKILKIGIRFGEILCTSYGLASCDYDNAIVRLNIIIFV